MAGAKTGGTYAELITLERRSERSPLIWIPQLPRHRPSCVCLSSGSPGETNARAIHFRKAVAGVVPPSVPELHDARRCHCDNIHLHPQQFSSEKPMKGFCQSVVHGRPHGSQASLQDDDEARF